MAKPSSPHLALVDVAQSYVGVLEIGGDNLGPEVEAFQRSVGGKPGDPWCMDFVQFCVQEVERKWGWLATIARSGSVLQTWQGTALYARKIKNPPVPGMVAIWMVNGSHHGHSGIVVGVDAISGTFETVEGNTGPGKNIDREGDGVYEKTRQLAALRVRAIGGMRLVGFIDPFR
jgi:hypothetical protein